jgi:hypothetical protein
MGVHARGLEALVILAPGRRVDGIRGASRAARLVARCAAFADVQRIFSQRCAYGNDCGANFF